MKYYLAPMESLTTYTFRQTINRHFGGFDKYFTPFISPLSHGAFNQKEKAELLPENNAGMNTVPQLLTARAEDFLWGAYECEVRGYGEVNLNLGCPSGTVVSKKKGAGMLADPENLDRFLYGIFAGTPDYHPFPGCVSVKTRLGISDHDEFDRILEVYNKYPISELTIHARVRKDFYKGKADLEAFVKAAEHTDLKLVYNGDIYRPSDCAVIEERVPETVGIMMGRGVLTNPALARQLKGGAPLNKAELKAFVSDLTKSYTESGIHAKHVLPRMKEHWHYLIYQFTNPEKYAKDLRKAQRLSELEAVSNRLFREQELVPDAGFGGQYLEV